MSKLRTLILDETDQMLDIGFQEIIEKIIKYVTDQAGKGNVQHLLYSATMPSWVGDIASKFMREDVKHIDLVHGQEVKTSTTVEHLALLCPSPYHFISTISDVVSVYCGQHGRVIIFTETKQEANDVLLKANLKIECQVLHGEIPQKQREITFQGFRDGKFRCLVATNVAARGLDIPHVDLIVQLGPPKDVDTYIHRSGRTARAGRAGTCITFFSKRQQMLLDRIQREAKITFKKIGAPQPAEIIKASARDLAHSFDNVNLEMLPYFEETAEVLKHKFGKNEALQRALAVISGYTKEIKQRSLLMSADGYITVVCETREEIRSMSFVWGLLRSNFSPDLVERVKGMKLLANGRGCAFDLAEEDKHEIQTFNVSASKASFSFNFPYELPELVEEVEFNGRGSFGRGGSYGGSYGGGGRDSSFGRRDFGGRSGSYGGSQRDSSRPYERDGRDSGRYGGDRGGSQRGSAARGDDDAKVFVGNLGFNVENKDLIDFFAKNNVACVDAYIIKKDGEPRGFGYAQFENPDDARRAQSLTGRELLGRGVRIGPANRK